MSQLGIFLRLVVQYEQQSFISRLTAQVGWLGLGVGSHPALSLHSSNEPGELLQ